MVTANKINASAKIWDRHFGARENLSLGSNVNIDFGGKREDGTDGDDIWYCESRNACASNWSFELLAVLGLCG